jgi:hemerythrin-like domain-containing protein
MTTTGQYFDGREMVMAHNVFRRELGLLPCTIRAVPAGDAARCKVVAEHGQLIFELLHHHHHLEDSSVWPTLLERCAPQVAPAVQAMQEHHAAIASMGAEIGKAMNRWQATASADDQAELAGQLDLFLLKLREHLSLEEKEVVPAMEKAITAKEWAEIQSTGLDSLEDPALLVLTLGMMFYESTPEVMGLVLENLPAEQREPMRQQAAQAFAEYCQKVHGTPTPPRSTEL